MLWLRRIREVSSPERTTPIHCTCLPFLQFRCALLGKQGADRASAASASFATALVFHRTLTLTPGLHAACCHMRLSQQPSMTQNDTASLLPCSAAAALALRRSECHEPVSGQVWVSCLPVPAHKHTSCSRRMLSSTPMLTLYLDLRRHVPATDIQSGGGHASRPVAPLDASRGPGMYDTVNLPLLGQQQASYAHQPMYDFSKGAGRQLGSAPTAVSRGS